MLLPSLGYAGDAREIEAFYRAVAESTDLPIMAYNNPKASGTDMPPALVARLAEIDGVVAIKECSGDARRLAELLNVTEGFEVLVGGDDWALEGFCAGATGWISGVANIAPRECVDLLRLCREGRLDEARDGVRPHPAAGPARHAAQAGAVLQGRHGPDRPPRRALPPAAARVERRASAGRWRRPWPRWARGWPREAGRVLSAVDSHTEGMPTRVVTGGVEPIPGASMLERKLHFEQHMDGLRLMLMREPRGHGAMSGAILQPPLREEADWGVLFIEVSGCLPMCGHGTIGVATVLVERGMVAVSEPETVVRLDTPAGLVEARVAVEDGRARSVALRNVPSFLLARDRQVELEWPGTRPTTWPSAATSTRSCPPSRPASRSIPRAPVSWSSAAWR